MIELHRIRGQQLFLNADLIQSVEATPDTVVTLVDGRKVVVQEDPMVVLERIRSFRASVLRAADDLRRGPGTVVPFSVVDGGD